MQMEAGVPIMNWAEDVSLKNVEEFRSAVWRLLATGQKRLVLDLGGTSYLNSAALGVIADSVIQGRRFGQELVIAGVESTVDEIFRVVKFGTFMHIFRRTEEALHYLEEGRSGA